MCTCQKRSERQKSREVEGPGLLSVGVSGYVTQLWLISNIGASLPINIRDAREKRGAVSISVNLLLPGTLNFSLATSVAGLICNNIFPCYFNC